jgi:membrane associated rhomboid family serine protease
MSFPKELVEFDTASLSTYARALLEVIAFLWVIHLINWSFCRGGLNSVFGIRPREVLGLPGIVTAHFLHGADPDKRDFEEMNAHLVGNTLVLAPLGLLIILNGVELFYFVTVAIALICGLGTWLFGKENTYHVGSSGVIYGYFGFILLYSLLSGNILRFVLAIGVGIFYRRMILAQTCSNTSWEMHLFGLLGGVFAAYWVSYGQVMA